jgi:hypothetical protein
MSSGFFINVNTGFIDGVDGISVDDIYKTQKDLAALASEMPRAAVRALNTAMTGVKTDMKTVIRAGYNYKAASLEKRITIKRVTVGDMTGYVRSKGGSVHLIDIAGTRQLKKGVKVQVKKSSAGDVIPQAFLAPGENSEKLIVLRRPKMSSGKRFPRYGTPGTGGLITMKGKKGRTARLEWFMTMQPEFIYNTKENWAKISIAVKTRLDTNIARETDAELRRLKGAW